MYLSMLEWVLFWNYHALMGRIVGYKGGVLYKRSGY